MRHEATKLHSLLFFVWQVFGQVIEGLEVLDRIESAGEKKGLRLLAEVKILDSGQMDP